MPRFADSLIDKIQSLTPAQLSEVEEFIESLQGLEQVRTLSHASAELSEPSLERIWSNPEDDAYDAL